MPPPTPQFQQGLHFLPCTLATMMPYYLPIQPCAPTLGHNYWVTLTTMSLNGALCYGNHVIILSVINYFIENELVSALRIYLRIQVFSNGICSILMGYAIDFNLILSGVKEWVMMSLPNWVTIFPL